MEPSFDIAQLDASFHLKAFKNKFFLRAPLGVPDWQREQLQIIHSFLLGKQQSNNKKDCAQKLEAEICRALNVKFCLTTDSGREAIKLALIGTKAKPGDRVLLPSYCCPSVLQPILELQLKPVFVDSGENLQIDPHEVRRIIRPGDHALIVPHLFGGLANIPDLVKIARNNGAVVIDDAAQSIGLEGSWGWAGCGGDVGILSFGLFKPLNAMGGGALITNDEKIYERSLKVMQKAGINFQSRSKIFKDYLKTVWRKKTYRLFLYHRLNQQEKFKSPSLDVSFNQPFNHICPFNAHLASSQLDLFLKKRHQFTLKSQLFVKELEQLPFIKVPGKGSVDGFPRFVIQIKNKTTYSYKNVFMSLLQQGIEVQPTYSPLHRIIGIEGSATLSDFSNSETFANTLMCLPFPTPKTQGIMIQALLDIPL